jgi:hypothetical protein
MKDEAEQWFISSFRFLTSSFKIKTPLVLGRTRVHPKAAWRTVYARGNRAPTFTVRRSALPSRERSLGARTS